MNINQIDIMNGHDFETFCAELLKNNGFTEIVLTKGSGDRGVDLIASKNGYKYVVQCKRYSGNVGNKAIQEIYSGKDIYHADKALVITNSDYTAQAMSDAISLNVELWNRNTLQLFITRNQPDKNDGPSQHEKDTCRFYGKFNIICAKKLVQNGFSDIQIIKSGDDYGIDIIALKDNIKYGIQCNNLDKTRRIENFMLLYKKAKYYGCSKLMVISENIFENEEILLANELNIELIQL